MGLTLKELRPTGPTLDFAYRFFGEYRRALARDAAGIDLDQMKGFRYALIVFGVLATFLGGGLGVAILNVLGKVSAALP